MTKPVSFQCNLCGAIVHKSCDVKYEEKYHQDGSWLCSKCHKSERLWHNQDFSYNEVIKHDKANTGRTPVSTKPKQKKLAKKNFELASTKPKQRKEFMENSDLEKKASNFEECIDLSSDSEGEVEEDGNSFQQDVFSVAEEAYLNGDDDSDCQIEIYEVGLNILARILKATPYPISRFE